tara:strand:- start:286 stop:498 length:213 start_codon:yes stop_codon:yes gene_type:complete
MPTEQSLAYEVKRQFCYLELHKWKDYLCDKRKLDEVEVAIAATTSIINEIRLLDDKIYNEDIPPYDDILN